jgi:hypothetical protein
MIIFAVVCIIIIGCFIYIERERKSKMLRALLVAKKSRVKEGTESQDMESQDIETQDMEIQAIIEAEIQGVIDDESIIESCPTEKRPPCNPGYIAMENDSGQLCCYTDPKSKLQSRDDMIKEMGISMLKEEVTEQVTKHTVKMMNVLRRRAMNPAKIRQMASLTSKGAAMGGKMLAKKVAKSAAKASVRIGAKVAPKMAMGPVGWALTAVEITGMVLDVWDPVGYGDFSSVKVHARLRNKLEMDVEEHTRNNTEQSEENIKYLPMLADPEYAKPFSLEPNQEEIEKSEDFQRARALLNIKVGKLMEAHLEALSDDELDAFLDDGVGNYERLRDEKEDSITEKDVEMIYCDVVGESVGKGKIKYVDGIGCSMTKVGCDEYNTFEGKKPEDERGFGLYTDTYRIRNIDNPGSPKNPNMVAKKLSEKVCLFSPLQESAAACKGKGTFNDDLGICSYDNKYCHKMGYKKKFHEALGVNDCVPHPGQFIPEAIFGKTITRGGIKAAQLTGKGLAIAVKFGADNLSLDDMENAANLGVKYGEVVGRKALEMGKEGIDKLGELSVLGKESVVEAANKGIDAVRDGVDILREFGPDDAKKAINKGAKAVRNGLNEIANGIINPGRGLKKIGSKAKRFFGL